MKTDLIEYCGLKPSTWVRLLGWIQLVLAGIASAVTAFLLLIMEFAMHRRPDIWKTAEQNMNSEEIEQFRVAVSIFPAIYTTLLALAVSHFVRAIVLLHGSYTKNKRIISACRDYTIIWLIIAAMFTMAIIANEPLWDTIVYSLTFFAVFLLQGVCLISMGTGDNPIHSSVGKFSQFTNA